MPAFALSVVRRHGFAAFLIVVTGARLCAAAIAPLSPDEAYYRVWALAPSAGYPDHPPMVAVFIRAGMALAGDRALGIRLFASLSALAGSVMLALAGRDLVTPQAGRRAAILLNATLLLNAGAVIITPDTPLLLFWTATFAALARASRTGNPAWLLAAGLAGGLTVASKYTGFILAPAALLWLLSSPRSRMLLRSWQAAVAPVLSLVVVAPVLAWNARHGWVSFVRQGGRAGDWAPSHAFHYLGELIAGQIGLATPLVFAALIAGVVTCWRRGHWRDCATSLPLCLTLFPAAVFLQHALGGRVQANWPAVIYPGAAVAAASVLAGRWWKLAAGSGLLLSALVLIQAAAAPLPLPRRLDFTLIRLGGWTGLADDAARALKQTGGGFLVSDEYGLASELAFLVPSPVLGDEPRWSLFDLPRPVAGLCAQGGLLIRSTRREGGPGWPGAVFEGMLTRSRGGVVAETYRMWRVGPPPPSTLVLLPGAHTGTD